MPSQRIGILLQQELPEETPGRGAKQNCVAPVDRRASAVLDAARIVKNTNFEHGVVSPQNQVQQIA